MEKNKYLKTHSLREIEHKENNENIFHVMSEEGYIFKIHRNYVWKSIVPRKISKSNPFTIRNIKEVWLPLHAPDYELLDTEYVDAYTPMTWVNIKRKDLPPFDLCWSQFQSRKTHPIINLEIKSKRFRKKRDRLMNEINIFLNKPIYNGWAIVEGELDSYKNNKTLLKFAHEEGYLSSTTFNALKKGSAITLFWVSREEESTFNMKLWLSKNTQYTLGSNEKYRGNESTYKFICPNHGQFEMSWDKMTQLTNCYECYLEKLRGENNPRWNFDISEKERLIERDYYQYKHWRNKIFEKYEYTCQCCEKIGGILHAHHLDGYNWCESRRLDDSNGTLLCEDCHFLFHKEYGYGGNTEEQFINWLGNMKHMLLSNRDFYESLLSKLKVKKIKIDKRKTAEKQSGVTYVTWRKDRNKWIVKIHGKHIGYFSDLQNAVDKRNEYLKKVGVD